jgi:hypothetical protein
MCPAGQYQLCDSSHPCPVGYGCLTLVMFGVCQPQVEGGIPISDSGPLPEAGPMPDAGGTGD